MTAQHRPTPPHSASPRRSARGGRTFAGAGRASFGHPSLAPRGPVPGEGRLPVLTAANDNQPTLRWRLTRLAASLGVLTLCGAIVMILDS